MLTLVDERQRRLVLDSLGLGVVGALAAQLFMFLFDISQKIFLEGIAGYKPPGLPNEGGTMVEIIGSHGLWLIPVATTLGGLIAGIMVFTIDPEAEGHGTDAAIKAFHRSGGFIRARVIPLKMIASAVTIGSGGTAGREGPTSLIAAGIGSIYGTLRHRSDDERRLLVLIGMAAGLSAIFRTPIGAAIFAIEVLYDDMEFETNALLYTILASVVAYSVNGAFVGWEPLFQVPSDLDVSQVTDYLEYAILGILGGFVAALLPLVFYKGRDLFHSIPIKPHFKPALGGLLLGLMALKVPEVLGGGYGWMQHAINGELSFSLQLTLMFAEMVAMTLTVSSGGSGGVLAPSMFVGAMMGGMLASVFNQPPAAFVLVGMAAVFSGAGRVPIATLFMVIEITGGYHLLAPAALVVTLSTLIQATVSSPFKYRSLHEAQVPLRRDRDVDLLEGVQVSDVMTLDYDFVSPKMLLKALALEFERTHHHGFAVLDDEKRLFGIVTLGDLEKAMISEKFDEQTVADIATVDGVAVGYPDESISTALFRMGSRRVGRLPIVDRKDHRRVVGMIRRRNIVQAYEQAIASRKDTSTRLRELREAHEGNVRVLEADITSTHPFNGKLIKDVAQELPPDCILVSIRRGKKVIIPHGSTVLRDGDHIVTLASELCLTEAEHALSPQVKTEE